MAERITDLVVSLPAFLLAIILHEVAHGYVAYRLGDDTAKRAGRLTMSPLPHIDPIGAIFFVISSLSGMGFGWAKPPSASAHAARSSAGQTAATPRNCFGGASPKSPAILVTRFPPIEYPAKYTCSNPALIN